MKKIIVLLIAVVVIVGAYLGYNHFTQYSFTHDAATAVSENQELELFDNSYLSITEGKAVRTEYLTDKAEEFEGDFSVSGVKIGSTAKDFVKAFGLKKGQAMWETYLIKGPKEIIFNYPAYTGSILSRGNFDDLFLTVGYHYDDSLGAWQVLSAGDLCDIYNRDLEGAALKKYENSVICIISAGFDGENKINQIDIDFGAYYNYNENYAE